MRFHDSLLGVLLTLFGGWVLIVSLNFPDMPGQSIGPGTFPSILGIAFILGGIGLAVSGLVRGQAALVALNAGWRNPSRLAAAALATLGAMAFAIGFETIGFPLGGFVLLTSLFLLEGYRNPVWILLSAGFVAGLHLVMTRLLLVPLPDGVLKGLL